MICLLFQLWLMRFSMMHITRQAVAKNEENDLFHAILGLIVEARTWTHFPEWHNMRYLLWSRKHFKLTCPELMSWPVRNIQFGQPERRPGVLRWGWFTRKRSWNVALPLWRPAQLLCREAKSGSPTHICPLNGRLRYIQTYCPNHTIMSGSH